MKNIIRKEICPYCYGKKYYSVYQGGIGGYTDFGPMKYFSHKEAGTENRPCGKCNGLGFIEILIDKDKQGKI